ncbi:MAG: CGLD27 family protein [Cyanobacteria bacterium]|nr:CGLD27 family protein [Cyanobacteriota bacterium]MDA1245698.1 CGLD27 family protein [Cyanobacteriota bacterium]
MPCPVPPEQRPLQEYEQLLASWFFVWPSQDLLGLLRPLATSWLLLLPVSILVASGSWVLRHHPAQLVLLGMLAAVALPMLLLVRQWLGWNYVHRRLVSERVEYEESGWYDGQVWEKPLAWRQQDLLVAQHQVQPVLRRLQQGAALAVILALVGASLCQAL